MTYLLQKTHRNIDIQTDIEVNSEFIGFPENRHQLAIVMGDKDGPYITKGWGMGVSGTWLAREGQR